MSAGLLATARTLGAALRAVSHETVDSPSVTVSTALANRRDINAMLADWYAGTPYDPEHWAGWTAYITHHRLPKWIRAVVNPVQRAVDWYAGHLYRGTWTEDGRPLPDGTPHVLPIPDDVWEARPDVVRAAMQALDWSNWRSVLPGWVAGTMLLSYSFVEIQDDLEGEPRRRKVKAEVIPVWQVKDVTLNAGGDVKTYVLEFGATDERGRYTFRKEVDGTETRTYRNDRLATRTRHGYGFCPGVWTVVRQRGSRYVGTPLVASVLSKLDRINALIAHAEANVSRQMNQPMLLLGRDGTLRDARPERATASPAGQTTTGAPTPRPVGEGTIQFLGWDAEGGGAIPTMSPIDLAGVNARIAAMIAEVEKDLPEIVLDEQLRGMSQVTGPGAEKMVSDVRARFDEAQTATDAAIVKVMQMLVSIGCHRAHTGSWGEPAGMTEAQKRFLVTETVRTEAADGTVTWEPTTAPVGLDSYSRGALSLSLERRALLESVPPEAGTEGWARVQQMRVNYAAGLRELTRTELKLAGVDPDDIETLLTERDEQDAGAERLLNRGAIASEAV